MNIPGLKVTSRTLTVMALPMMVLVAPSLSARGISDQWYIGIGGTGSWLQPDPDEPGNNVSEAVGAGGTFMLGKDLDSRASLQFQGVSLGEATLDDGNTVAYNAADASVLYRFFDTRDNNLRRSSGFGTSGYGRFALGYMSRESDTDLEKGSEVYFGVGGGLETYFTQNIAVRAEGFFHDIDSVSASVSLVFRIGGTRRGPGPLPGSTAAPRTPNTPVAPTVPQAPPRPEVPSARLPVPTQPVSPTVPAEPRVPEVPAAVPTVPVQPSQPVQPSPTRIADRDRDGVSDNEDTCPQSTPGYPVKANGCALFDGVLSGIKFITASDQLVPGSEAQLDYLVDILVNQFPSARIELHSHTDNDGDVRSQAVLTRGRLRTVGTYLVDRGVRANRLVLRSFGGSRPLYDNATQEGRDSNNRIEVLERPQ